MMTSYRRLQILDPTMIGLQATRQQVVATSCSLVEVELP